MAYFCNCTVRRTGFSLFCLLTLQFLPEIPAFARQGSSAVQRQSDLRLEQVGDRFERRIARGERHAYSFALRKGEFVEVNIEQQGSDVALSAYRPDGTFLIESDFSPSVEGREPLYVLADTTGDFGLAVEYMESHRDSGTYEISLRARRKANHHDSLRAAGVELLKQAIQVGDDETGTARAAALASFQEALGHFQAIKDTFLLAVTCSKMASLFYDLERWDEAIAGLEQALPLWQALGIEHRIGATHALFAFVYGKQGKFALSLDQFEQALDYLERTDELLPKAAILTSLGGLYTLTGSPQKALQFLRPAAAIWRQFGETDSEMHSLGLLIATYSALGDTLHRDVYQARLTALQSQQPSSILQLNKNDKIIQEAAALQVEARQLYAQKTSAAYQRAIDLYEQARVLWLSVDDRRMAAHALMGIGAIKKELGELEIARQKLAEAHLTFEEVDDVSGQAAVLANLGEIHFVRGQNVEAKMAFREGLTLALAAGLYDVEAAARYHLARIARLEGDLAQASQQIDSTLAALESIRATVISPELRATFFARSHTYFDFAVDLLMERHQQQPDSGFAARALQISEHARARSLLELLEESDIDLRAEADTDLLAREDSLRRQIDAQETRLRDLRRSAASPEQHEMAANELAHLLSQAHELEEMLRDNNPEYMALVRSRPLEVPEIQRRVLDDQTLLLHYHLGETRSFLWVVSSTSISGYALPKRAIIDSLARLVHQQLTARNRIISAETRQQRQQRIANADRAFANTSAVLSTLILAPAAKTLDKKRLLIAADGALHYVPFAALPAPIPEGQGEAPAPPLLVRHEIISTPSASVLAILRESRRSQPSAAQTIAVVADPVYAPDDPRVGKLAQKGQPGATQAGIDAASEALRRSWDDLGIFGGGQPFPRLVYTRREARAIAQKIPAQQSLMALDFDASVATVQRPELADYGILHFATHGVLNSRYPELSGLVFSLVDSSGASRPGFLRLQDIYRLRLHAHLIVLSACNTALGPEIRGEGLIGLTRGFLHAGASTVVASLWSVQEYATAELMTRFYAHLWRNGRKSSPGAAMRAAQLEIREMQNQRWQSPYYWAAFVVQGEW